MESITTIRSTLSRAFSAAVSLTFALLDRLRAYSLGLLLVGLKLIIEIHGGLEVIIQKRETPEIQIGGSRPFFFASVRRRSALS